MPDSHSIRTRGCDAPRRSFAFGFNPAYPAVSMNEWNIQGRAHACQTCGNAFADRQPYHTLLFDERQDYRRLDVCPTCWETRHSPSDRDAKGFISHWQGVYEAPPPPTDVIQKDTAESLLRKLIERNDPRYAPAGFILAVMLERKRVLKVKEQLQREGQRVFVYEQPKTGDVFTIADPNLHLDQLESVQHDVANLLEHGLPALEAAPAAAPTGENPPAPDAAPVEAAAPPAAEAPLVVPPPGGAEEKPAEAGTPIPESQTGPSAG